MKLKKISVREFIETLTDDELKNVIGGYDVGDSYDCCNPDPFWIHPKCSSYNFCRLYDEEGDYVTTTCQKLECYTMQAYCDNMYNGFGWTCSCCTVRA